MSPEIVSDTTEEKAILTRCIASKAPIGRPLQILEAGCGNKWQLKLSDINYTLTGVDVDKEAVDLRQRQHNDLHEVIIGDLRTVEMPAQSYDVIYTAYVLEHVGNIERVLDNFQTWLKPGGLLIIKVPDRDTVYGFMARMTPHWVHIWYYRLIKGNKNAGKPGYLPYPTVYDPALGQQALRRFCRHNGLAVKAIFGKNNYLRKRSFRDRVIRIFVQLMSLFSFGRLAWHYNDLIYIIEKNRENSD
ncbi:class I SAM-dependent methyltransferase [Salinimonas marina]|uniref:Class I SAM-dependent methyltransferase n=1 Tax=Salinimonas marina TaxID=2785918 RepID=A0A7S9HE76_9ALTE|nr:class I SAM-dependent methyltransferase [Salinimonas marina]QPG06361.1 class I SAM-dependent methyltransferase [Salinimonas marina]